MGCGQFGQGHSFCSNFTFVMFHHLYTGNTAHLHTDMSVPIAPSPAVPTASACHSRTYKSAQRCFVEWRSRTEGRFPSTAATGKVYHRACGGRPRR